MRATNKILLAMLPVVALAAFVGGRASAPEPFSFDSEDGKLFGIIRAGNVLTSRNTGWEVRGNVLAGIDVVVYLKGGHTVMRPLAVAAAPCGWPSDFDPDMTYVPCRSAVEISGENARLSGATVFGRGNVSGTAFLVHSAENP